MRTAATSVTDYLQALPSERRATLQKLRKLIRDHLPAGYREVFRWGMITYEVPLEACPDTYNGEPLMYAALAAQKHHYGVYLCGMYTIPAVQQRLTSEWKKRGKRLDMGKSCIRLKDLEACEPDLIAEAVAAVPMPEFVAHARAAMERRPARTRAAAGKAAGPRTRKAQKAGARKAGAGTKAAARKTAKKSPRR